MRRNQNSLQRRSDVCGLRAKRCLAAAIVALLGMLEPARSATEVRGQVDDMHVKADNAPVREVLNALSSTFNVTFKIPPDVDRVISGQYAGSLQKILARILEGNNYIIKSSDGHIELVVLGAPVQTPLVSSSQTAEVQSNASAAVPPSVPPLTSYLAATATPQGGRRR